MSSKAVLTAVIAGALRDYYGYEEGDDEQTGPAEHIANLFVYVGEFIEDRHPATPEEVVWWTSAQLGRDRMTVEEAQATIFTTNSFSLMSCDLGGQPTWRFKPWDHEHQWEPNDADDPRPMFKSCTECGAGRRIGQEGSGSEDGG